jgi:hypothetical protein
VFRVFVTNRSDSALEIWRDYNGRAAVECRIDELKNELAADHFCLRSHCISRCFLKESVFDELTGKIPTSLVERLAALNQGIFFRGLLFPLLRRNLSAACR